MANGDSSEVFEKTGNVPVRSGKLKAKLDFVVLSSVPFDLVIGRPTLRRLGDVVQFEAEEVRLHYQVQIALLSMVSEYSRS